MFRKRTNEQQIIVRNVTSGKKIIKGVKRFNMTSGRKSKAENGLGVLMKRACTAKISASL